MSDFYKAVYSLDTPHEKPYGRIQWKATNVFMDVNCSCGHGSSIEGYFAYYYRCPACNQLFAVGEIVKLIPLNEEQTAKVERDSSNCIIDDIW